jgi:hypothetical protein
MKNKEILFSSLLLTSCLIACVSEKFSTTPIAIPSPSFPVQYEQLDVFEEIKKSFHLIQVEGRIESFGSEFLTNRTGDCILTNANEEVNVYIQCNDVLYKMQFSSLYQFRIITQLKWIDNNVFSFVITSNPYYGLFYEVNVRTKTMINISPVHWEEP